MGTRLNRLTEAVLTCTQNLCFVQTYEKYQNFLSENFRLYSREILQYITWACFRNVSITDHKDMHNLYTNGPTSL